MSKLVQAGETAKTTTAAASGVLLARRGIRTHLVDMDPQASLTMSFGCSDPPRFPLGSGGNPPPFPQA
jgi:Mrp family chromosome partitioning ATPase